MAKKLLSVFMVLCLILAMAPAAFADVKTIDVDGTNKTLTQALSEAQNGDTIKFTAAGNYKVDATNRYTGPVVSLVVDEGVTGDVVIQDGLWMGATGGSSYAVQVNGTITIEGITFENTGTWNNCGLGISAVKGCTFEVENCQFEGFEHGVHMNNSESTLNVSGCTFENVKIAMSAQSDLGTLNIGEGNDTEGADFAAQAFGGTSDFHYNTVEAYEEAFNDSAEGGMDRFNNATLTPGVDFITGNVFYVDDADGLKSYVEGAASLVTIYLTDDITLTAPIQVSESKNITINGDAHKISFSGVAPCSAAFNKTDVSPEGIPSNVKLTINDVVFDGTDTGSNGYAVIVGADAFDTVITLNGCEFNGLYSAVYSNGVFNAPSAGQNKPVIDINDGKFSNTSFGTSVDNVTPGAIDNGTTVDVDVTESDDGFIEKETWNTIVASVTSNGVTKNYQTWDSAFATVTNGSTISLRKDVEVTDSIKLPDNVTLNGNGYKITMTGTPSNSNDHNSLIYGGSNCTITNVVLNAGGFKHGVQFYEKNNSTLDEVTIIGGTYTAIEVNGSTNIAIRDCNLNFKGYAQIEYGMGSGVTTIPSITVEDNVFNGTAAQVYVDATTTTAIQNVKEGTQTADELREIVMDNITNEGVTDVAVTIAVGSDIKVETSAGDYAIVVPDTYPITVADTANGSVDTSYSNASKGSVITVTVDPDEGFIVGSVSVTGEDGAVAVTRVNSTTYSFVMPESAVTVTVNFVSGSAGFVDVPAGAWYSDAVAYVYANGLMQGTSATTFEPDAGLTRSMVWAVLARMDGETVSGTGWQSVARAWAVRSGVSDGTDPNGLITREQLVTMLWRFAGEPTTDATLSGYSDAASVNAWAATAMAWAIDNGIITGVTDTTLVPQGTATRAQCAAILMRYVENV